MSFLITTTGTQNPVVLYDLGARSFPHPTSNYDLEGEYTIEEIVNSVDVNDAIVNGHLTATDDEGNVITAADLDSYNHRHTNQIVLGKLDEDTGGNLTYDGNPVGGAIDLGDLNDVDFSSPNVPSDGQFLQYDLGTGTWIPGSSSAAPVDSVNSQTGVVVLDADDISDAATTNKFVTQAQINDFHTHTNKSILDDLDENTAGDLTYQGNQIGVTDHTELTNKGTKTHAEIDSHISDLTIHRVINDSGTSLTELWSANKISSEINALSSGYNRRGKVINIVDNTQAPPTENVGDRYILDETGGGVHANWDGASANDIVEFSGTNGWEAVTPDEGWVAYVDSQNKDALFVDDGTPQWELRPVAITIHNDLGSIQGGTATERYHLTLDEHTDLAALVVGVPTGSSLIDLVDGSNADSLHEHDHVNLANKGTKTHSEIDSHIDDTTIHFTQAQISITTSQINDIDAGLIPYTPATGGAWIISPNPDNVGEAIDELVDRLATIEDNPKRSWEFGTSKNGNANGDQDLRRQDGTPTNESPYIIPIGCTLYAISAASDQGGGNKTWGVEVYKNNALQFTFNITAALKGYNNNLGYAFSEGDEVRIRFKKTSGNVSKPSVNVFFIES